MNLYNHRLCITFVLLAILVFFPFTPSLSQVRIKDVATVKGLDGQQVFGYSLVTGLDRSGDSERTVFTVQSMTNMLQSFGIAVPQAEIRLRNVAAVMIVAQLPPMAKQGSRLDVTVSSIGDARSLEGGTLLMTPLSSLNGEVLVHAQGPVSIGGFNIEVPGAGGAQVRRNHPLTGRIPNGGLVIRDIPVNLVQNNQLIIRLNNPDFTSASRLVTVVNTTFPGSASAPDGATVAIRIPATYQAPERIVDFIAAVEALQFTPDQAARVVINERTGTVVVGDHVRISAVAVSHGSLTVQVTTTPIISQPPPFAPPGAGPIVVPQAEIEVTTPEARVFSIEETATVADVASALNSLGVTPRDIVSIFQALKEAGALQGELVIM
ncbi:MAG: flagellar basal body P-ring protein FlgI [Candidatus Latescibacteria bacterium]|nr:flagellar basal body P-ring protein FlgI [Candidatus Latescibacterota bacterium]